MTDAAEAERHPRYLVESGDLLCARTGTVGRVGLATDEHSGWVFGSGLICVRIRSDSQVDPQFLTFFFMHPTVTNWVIRNARGTSIPNISAKVLGTLPVRLPPLPVQQAIVATLAPLDDSIAVHQRISQTTAELRDALLLLLFSGGISSELTDDRTP